MRFSGLPGMSKFMGRAAAVAGAAAITATLAAAPAQAATTVGTLQNQQTGLCLDGHTTFDAKVKTVPCETGNPHQQWKFTNTGDTQTIVNVATGQCLMFSKFPDEADFAWVLAIGCDANTPGARKWVQQGDTWRNSEFQNFCLDSSDLENVYAQLCGDRKFQNWRLNAL